MPKSKRCLVLDYETECLGDLVDGARLYVEALDRSQLGSEADERVAKKAVLALLAFAVSRLNQVTRLLRCQIDAEELMGSHNSTIYAAELSRDHLLVLRPGGHAPGAHRGNSKTPKKGGR